MKHDIRIHHDLEAGDLGRLIALHGKAYEHLPGFGRSFEAYVARTIAEYVLDNDSCGRIWLAERDDTLLGCTAIVLRDNHVGQLRWVLVDECARGVGLGGDLLGLALAYCRERDCHSVVLETTDGLPESQALYEKLGFRVTSNTIDELWDGPRPLIHMQLDLA